MSEEPRGFFKPGSATGNVPTEIWLQILEYLDDRDLARVARTKPLNGAAIRVLYRRDAREAHALSDPNLELARQSPGRPSFALTWAAKHNDVALIRRALTHGAGRAINFSNVIADWIAYEGYVAPLHVAARYGSNDAIIALLDNGADIDSLGWLQRMDVESQEPIVQTPLGTALDMEKESAALILIDRGADHKVEYTWWEDTYTKPIFTDLMAAIIHDLERVVTTLLSQDDANPNDSVAIYATAMHVACGLDSTNARRYLGILVNAGANVHARDSGGRTPLFFLCSQGHQDIESLNILIKAGADVNAQDSDGKTPLALAAETFNDEMMRVLIEEHNADPRIGEEEGVDPWTLLALMFDDETDEDNDTDDDDNKIASCLQVLAERGVPVTVDKLEDFLHGSHTPYQLCRFLPQDPDWSTSYQRLAARAALGIDSIPGSALEFLFENYPPPLLGLCEEEKAQWNAVYRDVFGSEAVAFEVTAEKMAEYIDPMNICPKTGQNTLSMLLANMWLPQLLRRCLYGIRLIERHLELGVDPNQADKNGLTSFHHLMRNKRVKFKDFETVLHILAKHGGNISTKISHGITILHSLLGETINSPEFSEEDFMKLLSLLNLHPNMGPKDSEGNTPLTALQSSLANGWPGPLMAKHLLEQTLEALDKGEGHWVPK